MVLHSKKQDKSNPDRQQQNLGQGNKSVTSVTASTFKQFTVIPTTRARTSQTSSTLVQDKATLTTIASTTIAEIVQILTQHQL